MWSEFFKKQQGLDAYLPYMLFVDDGLMQLKNGGFLVTYEIRGRDLSSSTKHELGQVSRIVNSALMKLGDGWMAHVDTVRLESTYYPHENECFFPDPVTKSIDARRRAIFQANETCFENKYYLTLTYTPGNLVAKKMFFLFSAEDSSTDKNPSSDKILKKYIESIDSFMNILSTQIHTRRIGGDEMLTYLHFCIKGLTHRVAMPIIPMYLDSILASKDIIGGLKPKIGAKNFRTISIKSFPNYLSAGFLDLLNNLNFEFRFSSRFEFFDKASSRKKIEKARKDWDQSKTSLKSMINDKLGSTTSTTFLSSDSIIMMHDADAAVQDNQSNETGYGYYTSTIVIMDFNEESLEENANQVLKILEELGLPSFIEEANAVDAWLGTMPGNWFANVRHPLISTHNLSHIIPITAGWAGEERHPNDKYMDRITGKKAPPMFYAATEGRTPFRVSLSVKDVGHTLMIGPTGSGKTALLAFIIAQFFRYKRAQVFAFDKDNCLFVLCRGAGGMHFDLAVSSSKEETKYTNSVSFCPLAHIDTAAEKTWAIEWISALVELQHNRDITVLERAAIADTIDIMSKETYAAKERKLSKFESQVQNIEVRQALRPYIQKDMYGGIFDGENDFISDSKFNVFEMASLMDRGEKIIVPALLYMFDVIKKRLDGSPTLIVLDEAWTFFRHALFAKKIEEWIRELRRSNCAVIFATQSISEVAKLSISAVILESCKTKIFLPNKEARVANKDIYGAYQSFGLNEKQISIIYESKEKRQYYLTSEVGNRLFEVLFDPLTLAFTGAADKDEIKKSIEIMEEHKENWLVEWLKYRKIQPDWVEYVRNTKEEFDNIEQEPDTKCYIKEFLMGKNLEHTIANGVAI